MYPLAKTYFSRFNATIRWVQRFTDVYIIGLQFIDPVGKTLLAEMKEKP